MSKQISFVIKEDISKRLKVLQDRLKLEKDGGVDFRAKSKVALTMLNWIVSGSSKESTVPPILTGYLRGSGSAFVGSMPVGNLRGNYGEGNPAGSYSASNDIITVGFNTAYAAKLHETKWRPGPKSSQSGDTGNKYIERHLKADGPALVEAYADFLDKELFT